MSPNDLPPSVDVLIRSTGRLELAKALASLEAQTYKFLCVYIADAAAMGLMVQKDYPFQIKIVSSSQKMMRSRAANVLLETAQSPFALFLDEDDWLLPDHIEKLVHALTQAPQMVLAYADTSCVEIDADGQTTVVREYCNAYQAEHLMLENYIPIHAALFRRTPEVNRCRFDETLDLFEDWDYWLQLQQTGPFVHAPGHSASSSFVHVPEFLYQHRLHAEQTTETQNQKQLELTRQIQNEARLREAIRRGEFTRFVSIIMLSYGKHTQTLQALQGLQKTVNIPHEVILYDNGSTEETVNFLKTKIEGQFPAVKVIYGDTNLGPAQGRRKALEYANGAWFIIFDNDEIPEPGWLEELLVRAESNPGTGAVCCRVTFPNGKLQFSGGKVEQPDPNDQIIDLGLHDFGKPYDDLSTCGFREVDWCPIGATLFTINIAPYLHDGYPNTFEDAGVSFALKKAGYRLLNAPGALVWHEHITFQPKVEMSKKYLEDRYNPKMMLKSVASFYAENGLIIKDEYIWRENGLNTMSRPQLLNTLKIAGQTATRFD